MSKSVFGYFKTKKKYLWRLSSKEGGGGRPQKKNPFFAASLTERNKSISDLSEADPSFKNQIRIRNPDSNMINENSRGSTVCTSKPIVKTIKKVGADLWSNYSGFGWKYILFTGLSRPTRYHIKDILRKWTKWTGAVLILKLSESANYRLDLSRFKTSRKSSKIG